jgi:hypothetical protein
MKHRLYVIRYIFITYVYELKGENNPGSFFIPPQALQTDLHYSNEVVPTLITTMSTVGSQRLQEHIVP